MKNTVSPEKMVELQKEAEKNTGVKVESVPVLPQKRQSTKDEGWGDKPLKPVPKVIHESTITKEIESESMEAVASLAKTNVLIGEAKKSLSGLKALETQYLNEREQDALERVSALLERSDSIVRKSIKFYQDTSTLAKSAASAAQFLSEAHEAFYKLTGLFEEEQSLQKDSLDRKEEELKAAEQLIEEREKELIKAKVETQKLIDSVAVREKKLLDGRETLKRAIERLKNNRI